MPAECRIKTRIQTEVESKAEAPVPGAASIQRPNAPTRISLKKGTGARQMFLRILKEQGVGGLYRGFSASMLNTFSMQLCVSPPGPHSCADCPVPPQRILLLVHDRATHLRQALRTHRRRSQHGVSFAPLRESHPASSLTLQPGPSFSTELALGALAAAFAQLFTIPVSVIATRQQLADKSISFMATLRAILADDGITGLWRGLKPSLVLTVNPAITYGMFERLKVALLKDGEKMTPGKAFVIGALSKTMATVVRPFLVA